MTLDEAIQHCEITAKSNEKLAEFYYKDSSKNQKSGDACQECATEHRQLAEWLRELKIYKEQEPCEDAISRQAVLDLCDKKTRYDIPYEYYEGKKYVRGWNEGKIINFTQLMQLPSVIPQSKTELCEDAISRQMVKEQMIKYGFLAPDMTVTEFVEDLPSVRSQPKIGHWIIIDDCELFMAKCSECGEIVDSRMISKYPYCHCGAKMVDLQENEEV